MSVFYAAVRKALDSNLEWTDLSTASYCLDVATDRAAQDDRRLTTWAAANPLQRIGAFEIKEVEREE